MTNILQMDWPKIRKLSLDEAQDMRMTAKDMVLAYQSKCEIDDAMGIDCRRLKAKVYYTQQLLGKLNHHIKTINKADNECKLSLRARLKEQKEIRNAMNIEMANIKKDRLSMISEINQLKAKIKELEKQVIFSSKYRKDK